MAVTTTNSQAASMSRGAEVTISQAVGIPLLQALITGSFIGLSVLALCFMFGADRPWTYSLVVGCLVACLSWLSYVQRFLYALKGEQPKVYSQTETVRVNLLEDTGKAGLYLDLPLRRDQITMVARSIINSRLSFSYADLVSTRLLTRAEYESLRSYFLKRGLLFWSGGSHHMGCELTGAGRAILRHFATPALPDQEGYTGL